MRKWCRNIALGSVGIIILLAHTGCGTNSNDSDTQVTRPCSPCRTFITAASYTGDLITEEGSGLANGILAADALCMADANYANEVGGVGTYKALIVDGTNRVACTSANCTAGGRSENINWVLHPLTEYYRSDGTTLVMTTNDSGIYDFGAGDLPASFGAGVVYYWTGLDAFPAWIPGRHCSQWTSSSSAGGDANIGDGGASDDLDIGSISGPANICSAVPWAGLLCVEQ